MSSAVAKQVAMCNRRARVHGLEGRLSVGDWQQTCAFFTGRCAYCGGENAGTIDHYWPLAWGGVTTQSNTVLACVTCNTRKAEILPINEQLLEFVKPEHLASAREYLEEVGQRHQESLTCVWKREPQLGDAQQAIYFLKHYCEWQSSQTENVHANAYALLRRRIFGVE